MSRKTELLEGLPRSILLEIAQANGIAGLSAKPKQEIVSALADGKIGIRACLDSLSRDDLKALCRKVGLDDAGRERSILIDRLCRGNGGTLRKQTQAVSSMARQATTKKTSNKEITQYAHKDKKRLNNPPVGLVTSHTEQSGGKKQYSYDPHLDPQLVWAGKAEHTSFDVKCDGIHLTV